MLAVNAALVRSTANDRGMTLSKLARTAGISRQALHNLLRPGFNPVVQSVHQVSAALGLDLTDMLQPSGLAGDHAASFLQTLRSAMQGDSRAFELLPALLELAPAASGDLADCDDPLAHQLLAAASDIGFAVTGKKHMHARAGFHADKARRHAGFFFGVPLMSIQRAVELTPAPMKKHGVFGAFTLDDFRRHL